MTQEYAQGKVAGLMQAAMSIEEWARWGTQSLGTMIEGLKNLAAQEEEKAKQLAGK
jgi:hypothetical protein